MSDYVSVSRDWLNQIALMQLSPEDLQEQAMELLCEPLDEPPEPVVILDLVENKVYGNLHIRKWDNIGDLAEGVHKLYAEQPAPVAVVLPERLQQILKFLDGAENLDGHWFNEPHPSGRQYWWRNELREALKETNLFTKQQ